MTLLEAKQELCRKLNISLENIESDTEDLFDEEDLQSWINLSVMEAWDYADWIFKEKAYTSTTVASQEDYDYPDDFISDSIYLLRVADTNAKLKTYKKIRYLDYMKYREENDTGKEKLWSDHRRFFFINPKAWDSAASRSIELWGKMRADNLVDSTASLPFSPDSDNEENSGNQAIVQLAFAKALASEKKKQPQRAQAERSEALQKLEIIAKRERESQADYEVYDTTFFKHQNLFPGGTGRNTKWVHGDDDSW